MKRSYKILILIAVYSLALGIRVYWLSQKTALHIDEAMSINLACYNKYMWSREYFPNKGYTGKELKEISLSDDGSLKNVFSDIYNLWKDNRDPPQTNLYYSFLRLSFTGFRTSDIRQIIIRGGILNLIFFTVSFIFFFLIMRLLFPVSALLQIAVTACAFLSTAAISNSLFLRPYQIQEAMFIIFCYCFVKTLDWKKWTIQEEKFYIFKLWILLPLITGITLLTGYYAIIFVGLFGLYIIYIKCRTKEFLQILFYILVLVLGIIIAQFLFQKYLDGYFSYRAVETRHTLFANFSDNVKFSVTAALTYLHKHFFSYPVIVVCAACLTYIIIRKQKIQIQKPAFFIFIAAILYSLIIMIVAPYKVLRYIMPVFPFLIIIPAAIIDSVWKKSKKIACAAMLLLYLVFLAGAVNKDNIEHTYREKSNQYIFTRNPDVPVLIMNREMWKYSNLIPYLHDEQIYYFITRPHEIFSVPYEEFYLVTEFSPDLTGINLSQFHVDEVFVISGMEPEVYIHNMNDYYYGRRLRIRDVE